MGLLLPFTGGTANADSFVWQDAATRATIAFPDTWKINHNQKPDDVLTIAAPGENNFALCRMRVNDDRRFVIYPKPYAGQVQRLNFSRDFWDGYAREFKDSVLISTADDQAIGLGHGSIADIAYTSTAGPKTKKRAIIAAANYHDKVFIVECSAEIHAFERWAPMFTGIIQSVRMNPVLQTTPTGTYRDFLSDPPLLIRGTKDIDLFVY